MKWSTKIGTFAGIGVYVHATFFILLAWVALTHDLEFARASGGRRLTLETANGALRPRSLWQRLRSR